MRSWVTLSALSALLLGGCRVRSSGFVDDEDHAVSRRHALRLHRRVRAARRARRHRRHLLAGDPLSSTLTGDRGQTRQRLGRLQARHLGLHPVDVAINGDLFAPRAMCRRGSPSAAPRRGPTPRATTPPRAGSPSAGPATQLGAACRRRSTSRCRPMTLAVEGAVGGRALLVQAGMAMSSYDSADPTEPFRSAPRTAVGVEAARHRRPGHDVPRHRRRRPAEVARHDRRGVGQLHDRPRRVRRHRARRRRLARRSTCAAKAAWSTRRPTACSVPSPTTSGSITARRPTSRSSGRSTTRKFGDMNKLDQQRHRHRRRAGRHLAGRQQHTLYNVNNITPHYRVRARLGARLHVGRRSAARSRSRTCSRRARCSTCPWCFTPARPRRRHGARPSTWPACTCLGGGDMALPRRARHGRRQRRAFWLRWRREPRRRPRSIWFYPCARAISRRGEQLSVGDARDHRRPYEDGPPLHRPRLGHAQGAPLPHRRGRRARRRHAAELDNGTFLVGTHQNNDLRLTDKGVSRYHLELQLRADGLKVTDLDTTNGTLQGGDADRLGRRSTARRGCARQEHRDRDRAGRRAGRRSPASTGDRFGDAIGGSRYDEASCSRCSSASPHRGDGAAPGRDRHRQGAARRGDPPALAGASDGPFVVVDCGALPRELIGSELFGHASGAFTGALDDQARAHRGGRRRHAVPRRDRRAAARPAAAAAARARAARGAARRRGRAQQGRTSASSPRPTATCRARCAAGQFREDLYFRLAVVRAHVPPLRERKEDIPLLVRNFVRELKRDGLRASSPDVLAQLMAHDWPGNVRELRNVVERGAVARGGALPIEVVAATSATATGDAGDYSAAAACRSDVLEMPFKEAKALLVESFERDYLTHLLRATTATSRARRSRRASTATTSIASSRSTTSPSSAADALASSWPLSSPVRARSR